MWWAKKKTLQKTRFVRCVISFLGGVGLGVLAGVFKDGEEILMCKVEKEACN